MTILVTGCAGFIGMHVCERLLRDGQSVTGIDNLNNYYSVELKRDRLEHIESIDESSRFDFHQVDLCDRSALDDALRDKQLSHIVHLAAQAGVRYSTEHPANTLNANVLGFINILDLAVEQKVEHLVYASSSSVYGANEKIPYSEHHGVDHPVSIYAASKRSNELMAHVYSDMYGLPTTGLRFFTVYGPWGRPDMSPMLFADRIVSGKPIKVFNEGRHRRDFTYIDDIVEGVVKVTMVPATENAQWSGTSPDPASSRAPFRIYNIGNESPVELLDYIQQMEIAFGQTAEKIMMPKQPGDVQATWSDTSDLESLVGYKPTTPLSEGLNKFAAWYRDYFNSRA